MFRSYMNNRRGHNGVSGVNHRDKLMTDSSTSNKKLASSAMNATKAINRDGVADDRNRRDIVASLSLGQTPTKDSYNRYMNSSTFNVSLDPSLRNAHSRRDDSVPYLASKIDIDRRNPLKDKNIKQSNTFAMHVSLATLSKTDNKGTVLVEANRQVSHASRPIKKDPPRKNTNTKRVEAVMPNGNVTRRDDSIVVLRSSVDKDPLKEKTTMNGSKHTNNSQSPQFKAMVGLVHRTKNFDGLDGYNDALPSRLKRQVSLDNGGGFITDNHSGRKLTIKATEEASSKRVYKQRNKEAKGDRTSDRNPLDDINADDYSFGVKDYSERNRTYGPMKRQQGKTKTNEDEAVDSGDMKHMEVEDGDTQLETRKCRSKNMKKRGIKSNDVGDGIADDVSLDCSNEATQPEKLTHRKLKKSRQDIMRNEDEIYIVGHDHSPLDADGDSSRLTSQAPISIDCLAEVPAPFVSEHVKKQCNYCSKPIDEPIWSGIFKIDEKEYTLAGHLSTKSCDKVWELSRSLMPVVGVTKLSRSNFKIWETSKPSCDSIGLFFFPNKMRHDEDLDKLVKEVIVDDLVLQTVIGEAEMLIFPSTLLPERYKTFQRKYYLWGVFRPRQDQHCATVAEPVHDTVCCAQENEKEEQHASNQQDEVQEVLWKSPAKSMQPPAATRGVPGSPGMDFRPEAHEERQLGDALRHTLHSAEATAVATNPAAVATEAAAALATNAAIGPAEATENGTNVATTPGNHGRRSDSAAGVPPGRLLCFVAGQTPKLEQLIQEMQREGSLVLAIRGEAIGSVLWPPGQATSPPLSSA